MSSIEKLEVLKQQEIYLKDFIQKLENQKTRLEIESVELNNFISNAEKSTVQEESPVRSNNQLTEANTEQDTAELNLNPNISIFQTDLSKGVEAIIEEEEEEEDDDDNDYDDQVLERNNKDLSF